MINAISDGISIALGETFGDGYKIYSENVQQGLEEPCFFIEYITSNFVPYIGNRKLWTHNFTIHFFCEGVNENLADMAVRVPLAIEYITLLNGDLMRGTDISTRIEDDVLLVMVNYKHFSNKTLDELKMLSQKAQIGVKDGEE